MNEQLMEAARNGDLRTLKNLLADGAGVNERDHQGWTPLSWAAGGGHVEIVEILLESGANVAHNDHSHRTPQMIAQAAGHREVAELLAEVEVQGESSSGSQKRQFYCRAFYLKELHRFPDWPESLQVAELQSEHDHGAGQPSSEKNDIVYLHQDFTLTRSMWHGEGILFQDVTPEWKEFCKRELGFVVPTDFL